MTPEQMSEIFEAVKVLPLRPGDAIVLRSQRPIRPDERQYLLDCLGKFFEGRKVLILDAGMDIDIVRRETVDA